LSNYIFSQSTNNSSAEIDTSYWSRGGIISLTFAQVSFTNWAAGGENSYAGNGLLNLFVNYKKEDVAWDNNFDFGYGVIEQKGRSMTKTDDKIDIASKYGKRAFRNWYYSGLINFKTQFAPGYNSIDDTVLISDFLSPFYGIVAAGLDYKPNDDFTMYLAPISAKITFVNNQDLANQGAFGVDAAVYNKTGSIVSKGSKMRTQLGWYVKTVWSKEVMKNISFQTKLELFASYLEKPGNIDVNWEALIAMKVNKYIAATIATHLIYDDDIAIGIDDNADGTIDRTGPRTQFKEVFGVSFSYKF